MRMDHRIGIEAWLMQDTVRALGKHREFVSDALLTLPGLRKANGQELVVTGYAMRHIENEARGQRARLLQKIEGVRGVGQRLIHILVEVGGVTGGLVHATSLCC